MKKLILLLSVFVSLGAFAQKEDAMVINKTNGDCFAIKTDSIDYVEFAQSNKLNKDLFNLKQTVYVHDTIKVQIHDTINVIVKDTLKLIPSGLEAVDLALPSGNLWANMNIGAKKTTDFGASIAWSEVKEKDIYEVRTHKYIQATGTNGIYRQITFSYTKYTDNSKWQLDSEDDAATYNWGEKWYTPSSADFEELFTSCTYVYTKLDGVNGYKFTGSNGNSIFLPAAGMSNKGINQTTFYWTRYLIDSNEASALNGTEVSRYNKYLGGSIRPILKK